MPGERSAVAQPAAPTRRLAALRAQLRRSFGAVADALPARALPTGWPPLDALLVAGGLPRGRLTAVAGVGATGLAHRLVAAATRAGTAAWLDPTGRLDAVALGAAGADLAEVIVSRPPAGVGVLRAAAILQRTGGVDLLVVDAPDLTARQARRLATLARLGATALVALAPPGAAWPAAEADLALVVARAAWRQTPTGLAGVALSATVARQRGGRDGAVAALDLAFARPWPPLPGLERLAPVAGARGEVRRGAS